MAICGGDGLAKPLRTALMQNCQYTADALFTLPMWTSRMHSSFKIPRNRKSLTPLYELAATHSWFLPILTPALVPTLT